MSHTWVWDIPKMRRTTSYGTSHAGYCMGCPICDHGISHIMYMGYPMGCPNIPMEYLVKPVDHVLAASRMNILWDIPGAILGYPIPLYRTSHGTSTGISYFTPQRQDSLCPCTFSRFSAPLRRRCSSFSRLHKPLSSRFFYLPDCTFQWKGSIILPQP